MYFYRVLALFTWVHFFARFGLWIATNMATAGPKHPQEFPWASGGAGWQWGAAKPMSGPSRAHETAISPSGLPDGSWVLFFFSGRESFGHGWDLALLASANHRRVCCFLLNIVSLVNSNRKVFRGTTATARSAPDPAPNPHLAYIIQIRQTTPSTPHRPPFAWGGCPRSLRPPCAW